MAKLFSYVVHHAGDPIIKNKRLVLGLNTCKYSMRKHVAIGDWILGTIGKGLCKQLDYKKGRFQQIAFLMRVDKKKFKKGGMGSKKFGEVCYSNNFYTFYEKECKSKILGKSKCLIKKNQGYKKFPHNESENNLLSNLLKEVKKIRPRGKIVPCEKEDNCSKCKSC